MWEWVVCIMLTMACWDLYGFLPKLVTRQLAPVSAMFYYLAGALLVGIVALMIVGQRPQFAWPGAMFAALTGVFCLLGGFFYLAALRQGKLAVVVTATALYPVASIALGFAFLNEGGNPRQGAGILLDIFAMLPMAG